MKMLFIHKIYLHYHISKRGPNGFIQRFSRGSQEWGIVEGVGYDLQSARYNAIMKHCSLRECHICHSKKRLKTNALNSLYPKGKVNKAWKTQ